MSVTRAQLAALAKAERGRVEHSKAAARVVHQIDQGAPRSAGQLSTLLKAHGLNLSDQAVRRLRYIARLLHDLDPERMDPEELKAFQDAETLYQLQRAAEVTKTGAAELLARLQVSKPANARDWLQAMTKAGSADATPESAEAWRPALPRVPASVGSELNKAFGAWMKLQDLTPLLATQALTTLLNQEGALGLTGLGLKASKSELNSAFLEWAAGMDLTPARAAPVLLLLLQRVSPEQWTRLFVAATKC